MPSHGGAGSPAPRTNARLQVLFWSRRQVSRIFHLAVGSLLLLHWRESAFPFRPFSRQAGTMITPASDRHVKWPGFGAAASLMPIGRATCRERVCQYV